VGPPGLPNSVDIGAKMVPTSISLMAVPPAILINPWGPDQVWSYVVVFLKTGGQKAMQVRVLCPPPLSFNHFTLPLVT
jgi:hypothetical protein